MGRWSAARAGPRNPHAPAHPGRQRRRRRRRRRRNRRRRRVIPLPDITGIVRALGNITGALGHPVPGMANAHVPNDTLVGPTPIHIQRIPRAPAIWAVAAGPPGTIARLGGTCAHTGQTQAAGHQQGRRQPHGCSPHKPGIILLGGLVCTGNSPRSRGSAHVDQGGADALVDSWKPGAMHAGAGRRARVASRGGRRVDSTPRATPPRRVSLPSTVGPMNGRRPVPVHSAHVRRPAPTSAGPA
jgi:hypothetical protein